MRDPTPQQSENSSASTLCRTTVETTQVFGEIMARHFLESVFADCVIELGWVDRSAIAQTSDAWRKWGEHPDALWVATFEVVGWKES